MPTPIADPNKKPQQCVSPTGKHTPDWSAASQTDENAKYDLQIFLNVPCVHCPCIGSILVFASDIDW